MKTVLIIISSKNPTIHLYNNLRNILEIQINNQYLYKIVVIDSDSDSDKLEIYDKIKSDFSDIEILFRKNKNYEYGAYKIAYDEYPNFDIYFCIQDTLILKKYIDLSLIDDYNIYKYVHKDLEKGIKWGWNGRSGRHRGLSFVNNLNQEFKELIIKDSNCVLCQHNSFICNNNNLKKVFDILNTKPDDKCASMIYERLFGLYFKYFNINAINLEDSFQKIHGKRL